ncbi:hypothetical protein Zmor_026290 [Zophobas morio]|uniref:Uncharacterized protein n=1 Tax=Zophobas morio TaxID=2755281 RepID=A0AA38HYZ3_9CUCU|nr:hypothetical protein Zmor_026290 [Zophobas morio]
MRQFCTKLVRGNRTMQCIALPSWTDTDRPRSTSLKRRQCQTIDGYVKMYWALYNEELKERLRTSLQSTPIEYKSTEDIEKTLTIINDSVAYEKT